MRHSTSDDSHSDSGDGVDEVGSQSAGPRFPGGAEDSIGEAERISDEPEVD